MIETFEDKMAASGAHVMAECWVVFVLPEKTQEIRMLARQTSFAHNNKEMCFCAVPLKKGASKLVQRAEFNSCGEISTSSTTYTGVPVRRFSELPRMNHETKASILGVGADGSVKSKRVQKDIEDKGHPFSFCEVKPLNLWQRICEHHQVTHIVDFSAGSAALAIAASGAMEYEGVAANPEHCAWLDTTLDRCVMYMAGKDKEVANNFGGYDEFMEKMGKYFAGTMMEARRLMEPVEEPNDGDEDSSESDE